jgi:hypothetical protein
MLDAADIESEMARAQATLNDLRGDLVPAVAINSLEETEAPFLAQIVSKLSPIIGNLLEHRIARMLEESSGDHVSWRRQDPGFPDAALFDSAGHSTGAGFEIKAWYVHSTEITGRFRESQNLLAPRDVRLVVVAWTLSSVVFGQPLVLDVLTVPAREVAASRDAHYWNPPTYLTVEPGNTTARTSNLQQSNVSGYRLQAEDDGSRLAAGIIVSRHRGKDTPSHEIAAQELAAELRSRLDYRLDTNFAKIDRVGNIAIEEFKTQVLARPFREHSIREWTSVLRALNSAAGSKDPGRVRGLVQALYSH